MNYIQKILLMIVLVLTSCVDYDEVNKAPVIESVVTDLSVVTGETITLNLTQVKAYDEGGDILTLVVGAGENYTVQGTKVIPNTGFIGDLMVALWVSDGELTSGTVYIIISVIKEIEMFPLFEGAWWSYTDSVYTEQKVLTSKMMVTGEKSMSIGAESVTAAQVQWSNLAEYGITYHMGTTETGTYMYGANSPTDTAMATSLLYPFPVAVGQTWQCQIPYYSASDSTFDPMKTTSCVCTKEMVYVTVPAGIFPCYEYVFTNSASPGATRMGAQFSSRAGQVIETLYFSPGVGYVKGVFTQGGEKVWVKELTDYHVVEAE